MKKPIKLAHPPEDPPLREVRKQMRIEIKSYADSYRESDGVIHNETAIYSIGCFRKALKLLANPRFPTARKLVE